MDGIFNKQINTIIGNKKSPTTKILSNQVPYSRKTVSQVNYSDVNNRIKQIFDRMPDVVKASGYVIVTLKNGKTLKINVSYK